MSNYKLPKKENWIGRSSGHQLYLNEKVELSNITSKFPFNSHKTFALLGYSSDEGVRRNQGRVGAKFGPDSIRKQLGKMPNHLTQETKLLDFGNLECNGQELENLQKQLSNTVKMFLDNNTIPIILGGSHDLAYGHYHGLLQHLPKNKTIGIINFDAHFDLRPNTDGNNSGTPFYQLAMEHRVQGTPFKYLALGVRKDANTKDLYDFAEANQAFYLQRKYFCMTHAEHVELRLIQFIEDVDYLYTTIDLDGFSSAYAPGVSAASPMGFSPDIVLKSLKLIIESEKLMALDVVELNPKYDIDDQTAKLAASLIHYAIHKLA
ncbi:formiminoglutamase [Maribacter sedimenticola]|uniref:Formimidoylglutamase n=1 Tax=Maribacter sedimenticola TaxID=228956 RepID=A0ABY1SDI9_9FLAO|nr:formimidoylglutamase [Maribacter sedimenticola]SNR27959.1 formiminoglutamase [Maribacter sedimenticola]